MKAYNDTLSDLKEDICFEICHKIHDLSDNWNNIQIHEDLENLVDIHDKIIDVMLFVEERNETI